VTTTIAFKESPTAKPSRGRHVFITGLGIGQICSWGSLYYSFPLIAEAMGRDLGYSKPELYGAAALGLVLTGLASYPAGVAIDRGHGRALMTVGSVLAGLLLLAWSQVGHLAVFYLLFAGIGLLQAATLYEPAFAVVARRFGAGNARNAMTVLTLWGGVRQHRVHPVDPTPARSARLARRPDGARRHQSRAVRGPLLGGHRPGRRYACE
jgi:MFS family permease